MRLWIQLCDSLDMSRTICVAPEADPSTYLVGSNNTFQHYSCRAGYRFESGNLQRSCDINGTWSGSPLVCAVDSILPKAYLVILIVGATVAVFLACIPYDFYRFRKRKKKVRDHQERLSLVTRIAPGHAKVVLETVPVDQNATGQLQGRRFGLKSLFSVFRFVGGKMKSPQGQAEAVDPMCPDDKSGEHEVGQDRPSVSDTAPESDGATASSYIFSTQPTPSCLAADVIDLCPLAEGKEADSKNCKQVEKVTTVENDTNICPRSSSPLFFDNNDACHSGTQAKKGFPLFKKASDILTRDLQASRHAIKTSSRSVPNADDSYLSEPATVEVTFMNEASSSGTDNPRGSAHEEFPTSKAGSSSSSTSSPDVTSLRKGDPKVESFRTFHYPSGKNSVAYHSMPTITDIP